MSSKTTRPLQLLHGRIFRISCADTQTKGFNFVFAVFSIFRLVAPSSRSTWTVLDLLRFVFALIVGHDDGYRRYCTIWVSLRLPLRHMVHSTKTMMHPRPISYELCSCADTNSDDVAAFGWFIFSPSRSAKCRFFQIDPFIVRDWAATLIRLVISFFLTVKDSMPLIQVTWPHREWNGSELSKGSVWAFFHQQIQYESKLVLKFLHVAAICEKWNNHAVKGRVEAH